ncbi:chemotaxis protein CheB [Kribbella sp. NPDC023855]|uniref:chemotaxis protein CheB n=1 Tax=Kribbella sp. NPDC023855 TaxID=3154698 RepID=UPI00340E29BB
MSPPGGISALAGILGAACPLPTAVAEHGAEIEPGHVYVAPPDHHLLVDGSHLVLSDEPPENGHRPTAGTHPGRADRFGLSSVWEGCADKCGS